MSFMIQDERDINDQTETRRVKTGSLIKRAIVPRKSFDTIGFICISTNNTVRLHQP